MNHREIFLSSIFGEKRGCGPVDQRLGLRGDRLLQRGTVCYVANCPGGGGGGGTLYYVVNCPGGTLLRSKVSGGHFTTGVVYFVKVQKKNSPWPGEFFFGRTFDLVCHEVNDPP